MQIVPRIRLALFMLFDFLGSPLLSTRQNSSVLYIVASVGIHRSFGAHAGPSHVSRRSATNSVPQQLNWCPFSHPFLVGLGPPVVLFYQLFWLGGFPYYNRQNKSWYPYSNLSTGGPRQRKAASVVAQPILSTPGPAAQNLQSRNRTQG